MRHLESTKIQYRGERAVNGIKPLPLYLYQLVSGLFWLFLLVDNLKERSPEESLWMAFTSFLRAATQELAYLDFFYLWPILIPMIFLLASLFSLFSYRTWHIDLSQKTFQTKRGLLFLRFASQPNALSDFKRLLLVSQKEPEPYAGLFLESLKGKRIALSEGWHQEKLRKELPRLSEKLGMPFGESRNR